jgi:hypothetical protein
MLHKSTELRFVNSEVGYGVFATELIPKGTIIAFHDPLDVEVKPEMFASLYSINVEFQAILEHFSNILFMSILKVMPFYPGIMTSI